MLGIALLIMLAAVVIVAVEPQLAYSAKMQRTGEYWAGAHPFSIGSYAITQSHILLEVQNSEAVSISVKGISVNGRSVNFSKIFSPYNESAVLMCSMGSCDMQMPPGMVEMVLIDKINSTSGLQNLCSPDGYFQEGRYYSANLSIAYQGASGEMHVQEGKLPLIGQCARITVNDTPLGNMPGTPLAITTSALPDGKENMNYSQTVTATGCLGTCSWSFVNLPWSPALQNGSASCAGEASSYLLEGFPTQIKTTTVMVSVTDYTRRTATKSMTLRILQNDEIPILQDE